MEALTMIQISYLSRASSPFSSEQLLALLQQCHANNTARGITGMLFYGNGTFLQVIEGAETAVDELVGRIARDSRHDDIRILSRKPIERREHPDWTMGFERVTDAGLRDVAGLRDFAENDFTPEVLAARKDVVDTLMDRFRAPHWDPLVRELDAKDKVLEHLRIALARQRGRAAFATLVIESLAEAGRKAPLGEEHQKLCESALRSLRGD
jgi:hypothetical protein